MTFHVHSNNTFIYLPCPGLRPLKNILTKFLFFTLGSFFQHLCQWGQIMTFQVPSINTFICLSCPGLSPLKNKLNQFLFFTLGSFFLALMLVGPNYDISSTFYQYIHMFVLSRVKSIEKQIKSISVFHPRQYLQH